MTPSSYFCPDCNAKRFQDSADRLCIPKIPVEDYIQAVETLVDVDRDWVPHSDGASLYIRPFVFANDVGLGVHASKHYIFCIICAPSGAYYAEGINPVRIYVEDEYIRAAPGLTGFTKCGGNYAASIKAGELAEEQGYTHGCWRLDGVGKSTSGKVGGMNIMFRSTLPRSALPPPWATFCPASPPQLHLGLPARRTGATGSFEGESPLWHHGRAARR